MRELGGLAMLTNGDSSWITPGSWFELNTFWLPANISNKKTTPPYSETFLPNKPWTLKMIQINFS